MLQTPSVSKKLKTMQTRSSSSLSPSTEHLQTPPPAVKRRCTKNAKIESSRQLSSTFCKRRGTLSKKLDELCVRKEARGAVVVISRAGRINYYGNATFEEVFSKYQEYLRSEPPPAVMRWCTKNAKIESSRQLCSTFCDRLRTLFKKLDELCVRTEARSAVVFISPAGMIYCHGNPTLEEVFSEYQEYLRSKSELNQREDLTGMVGAGGHSPGVGCDCGDLNDDEIDSLIENFKASRPSHFALFKDSVRHGDCEGHITSPVNLAAGGDSSGVEGCNYNATSGGSSGLASVLTCFDDEGRVFKPDDFLNVSEDCIGAGDRDGLLTLPENLAVGGGSSRERSGHSDLEYCGNDPAVFAALEELLNADI